MKINEKYEVTPFGNAFDSLFSLLTRGTPFSAFHNGYSTNDSPNLEDVRFKDEKNEIRIEFLVPGWKKSELDLSIESNLLRLLSKTPQNQDTEDLFRTQHLSYEIRLPEGISCEKAKANLNDGVLSVIIPKTRRELERKVKIN